MRKYRMLKTLSIDHSSLQIQIKPDERSGRLVCICEYRSNGSPDRHPAPQMKFYCSARSRE